jgi:hypothetical protein
MNKLLKYAMKTNNEYNIIQNKIENKLNIFNKKKVLIYLYNKKLANISKFYMKVNSQQIVLFQFDLFKISKPELNNLNKFIDEKCLSRQ